jgi:cyclopropane fatty-acyl-phospholipid synthase-like methyltransferase
MVEFWNRIIPPAATIQDADFLERALELKPGSRVLDVPCGNGRHAVELARRSCRVTGVDLSAEFLDLARRAATAANVDVEYRLGEMRDLPWTGEFDAAYCWGNSFGYLDYAGVAAFLSAVARALKPGGRIAIDSCVTAETILSTVRQRWHRTGDLFILSEPRYVGAESRLDVEYTSIQNGVIETKRASSYVFTAAEQVRMLDAAGFEVVALNGGIAGEEFGLGSPRLVITARSRPLC